MMAQHQTEAPSRPIITALTTRSAARNSPSSEKSTTSGVVVTTSTALEVSIKI